MKKVCVACNAENIEKAKFCQNCGNQLNCTNCNEELLANANNCIICGTSIKPQTVNQATMNTIDFRQTKDERTIKVAFTNDVAKDVRESIVQMSNIRANNVRGIEQPNANNISETELSYYENGEIEEDTTETSKEPQANNLSSHNKNIPHIKDIITMAFSESEWVLIMSFYASNYGKENFSPNDVRTLYNEHRYTKIRAKNYAANWKSILGIKKGYITTIKDNELALTVKGISAVLAYINGESKSNVGKGKSRSTKKKTTSSVEDSTNASSKANKKKTTKGTSVKASNLSLVLSLNLNPPKNDSLKTFYEKYQVANAFFEKNLIIIYYLERILKENNISLNHIYTCYKKLGLKVPGNLYQSLVDTKNRKGWIDTKDVSNIRITIAGENYVEHEMPKL